MLVCMHAQDDYLCFIVSVEDRSLQALQLVSTYCYAKCPAHIRPTGPVMIIAKHKNSAETLSKAGYVAQRIVAIYRHNNQIH